MYLLSNFTNATFFNFACNNASMKYHLWPIALCLVIYYKKYFKLLMEAVGDRVSPTNSLFGRSPLTEILIFTLSRIPSDWIFALYTSMHGVTGLPFSWSLSRKFQLLMKFLISLRVAFSQGLSMPYKIFLTSAKFLGSWIKLETYEPYSLKNGKSC